MIHSGPERRDASRREREKGLSCAFGGNSLGFDLPFFVHRHRPVRTVDRFEAELKLFRHLFQRLLLFRQMHVVVIQPLPVVCEHGDADVVEKTAGENVGREVG